MAEALSKPVAGTARQRRSPAPPRLGRRVVARLAAVATGILVSYASAGAAEQIAVAGAQEGYGLLRARGAECFAIAPRHVVQGAARLRVTTANGVMAPARLEREYDADLAILRIEPGLACPARLEVPADLRRRLKPGQRGVVTSTGPGGAVESRYVLIDRWDDDTIEFRPESTRDAMRPGLSGSLLLLDGEPAGMVLEIDTRTRRGRAYRMDFVVHTVARFFERGEEGSVGPGRHLWDGLWLAQPTPGFGQAPKVTFRIKVRGPRLVELTTYQPRNFDLCGLPGGNAACLPASEGPESRYGEIEVREALVSDTELTLAYSERRLPPPDPGLGPWAGPNLPPWLDPSQGLGYPPPVGSPGGGWAWPWQGPGGPIVLNLRLQAWRAPAPPAARGLPVTADAALLEYDSGWRPLPGYPNRFRLVRVGD